MAKAYSLDLRKKVISFLLQCKNKRETSKIFGIGEDTIFITNAECTLLFLPTYSPDLNPIEHCWHTIKSKLRPLIQHSQSNFQELIGTCLLTS